MTTSTHLRDAVETFIARAAQPSVLDAGEEPLSLVPGQWHLREWNGRLVLEAWAGERSLVRKIVRLGEQQPDRLTLVTERFPRKEGETRIADLGAPSGIAMGRKTSRLAFTARFGLLLAREFPDWRVCEVSAEPNMEHSLSPLYTRALLRLGSQMIAAVAAPPDSDDPAGIVAQGLVWLARLRQREKNHGIGQLFLFVPRGAEAGAALRASFLNPNAVLCHMQTYDERDRVAPVEFSDLGNARSTLPPCHRPATPNSGPDSIPALEGVDRVPQADGSIHFQVRGLEFARWSGSRLMCNLGQPRRCSLAELEAMARELVRLRTPDPCDPQHPLYTRFPEGWLESSVRRQPQTLDAALLPAPLYGQVPVFLGPGRDVVDILGVDHTGRLVVIELKVAPDLQLPFQALDYWARVNRHLAAGDFERQGYFPGVTLRREPPRLLLAAPALAFHSTTETVLGFLAPGIEVTRVGVAEDWRRQLRVMFRLTGSKRPDEGIRVNE